MTYPTTPNPSLGGGLFGRKSLEPVAEAAPPPPPPPPPPAMKPQFEVRYEAEVRRIEEGARTIFRNDMCHPTIVLALARARAARDLAEDLEFPGRRQRRQKGDAEVMARVNAVLAHQAKSPNAWSDSDGYYLQAAAGWITTYRVSNGKTAVPSLDEWREFDRTQGVRALMKGYIPDKVAPALTRLSPVAVRSPEALEQQAKNGKEEDLVIAAYGPEMHAKVRADIDKAAREAAASSLNTNSTIGRKRRAP